MDLDCLLQFFGEDFVSLCFEDGSRPTKQSLTIADLADLIVPQVPSGFSEYFYHKVLNNFFNRKSLSSI